MYINVPHRAYTANLNLIFKNKSFLPCLWEIQGAFGSLKYTGHSMRENQYKKSSKNSLFCVSNVPLCTLCCLWLVFLTLRQ